MRNSTASLCEPMSPIKYQISISLIDGCIKKEDIVKLHSFTGLPLTYFLNIENEIKIPIGEIVNEQFYSGVKEILALIRSLKSNFQLFSNESKVELDFLEGIVYKRNNIKLSDVR